MIKCHSLCNTKYKPTISNLYLPLTGATDKNVNKMSSKWPPFDHLEFVQRCTSPALMLHYSIPHSWFQTTYPLHKIAHRSTILNLKKNGIIIMHYFSRKYKLMITIGTDLWTPPLFFFFNSSLLWDVFIINSVEQLQTLPNTQSEIDISPFL